VEGISEPQVYFDANRMMKLRDKLAAPVAQNLLPKVISQLKRVAQELSPAEFISQSNMQMLKLSASNTTTKKQLQTLINELKESNYIVQLQML
jgi:hypothetical protein